MMPSFSLSRSPAVYALALAAWLGTGACLPAATYTWNGGGADANWSTAGNWSGGVPASSADTVLNFGAAARQTNTHNLTSPFQLNSLAFTSGAGPYFISGNGLNFTNSAAGTGPSLNQSSAAAVTLANALTLTNTLTLGGNGAGSVTLSGRLAGAGGLATGNTATTLNLTGGTTAAPSALGFLQLNGNTRAILTDNGTTGGVLSLSATGSTGFGGNSSLFVEGGASLSVQNGSTLNTVGTPQIHGNGAMTVLNNGVWNNTGTGNEIRVGYAGGTSSLSVTTNGTVNTGSLRLGHNFSQNQGHGSLTLTNNGALNATTLILDDTSGAAISVTTGGALTVGNISETQAGTKITLGNNGTLTVNGTTNSTFGGTLQNLAGQSVGGALTKAGAGTLVLSGASSGFSGSVNLNAGSLGVGNNLALGTAGVIANGGALYAAGADRTLANPFNLASGATLNLVSVTTDLHSLTLNGEIGGAGGLTVNAPGATVSLGGTSPNTFTGPTSVTAGTLLLIKYSASAPTSGPLSVGNATNPGAAGSVVVRQGFFYQTGTNTNLSVFSDGLFDLNSFNTALGSITMTGGEVRLGSAILFPIPDVITNASATSARITAADSLNHLNLNSDTHTFTVARGTATYDLDVQPSLYNGALVKAGAGTLRLAGVTSSGLSVTLNAGTLAVANNNALGSDGGTFTLAGGTVVADGVTRTISNPVSVTGNAAVGSSVDGTPRALAFTGAASLGANTLLTISNNATTTFSGIVSGAGSLLKTGTGTLALTNPANTFTGGLTLNGGTLLIAADGSLGAAGSVATLNAGTLQFAGSATTARTFLLGNALTLSPGVGNTLTYGPGASVNGGFLGAAGTHAFADGSVLNGTTTALGSTVTTAGAVSFANATVRGTLTQTGGTLAVANTVVSSAGTFTVNGTTNANGLEVDGVLRINGGGTVNNSGGTALVLGGGSRTTINAGGTLAAGGTSIELNGSLLVNNGTQTGVLNVNFGGVAKGTGTFGTVNVGDGGRFGTNATASGAAVNGLSVVHLTGAGGLANTAFVGPQPLAAPGTVNVASLMLGSGSVFAFSVQDAQGAAGQGYDLAHASGTLTLAAGTAAGNLITISVASLNSSGTAGQASNFDPTRNYTFVLVQADGGINGYNPAGFVVDSSAFQNGTQGGSFSVVQQGNNLDLVFTSAVPEPSTWALLGLGAIGVGVTVYRRRRSANLM